MKSLLQRLTALCALCLLLAVPASAQSSITFEFANPNLITEGGTQYMEVDIVAYAGQSGTQLGDSQVYYDYNTGAFGNNVVSTAPGACNASDGSFTVTKLSYFQGSTNLGTPYYECVNTTDNTSSKAAITYNYTQDGAQFRNLSSDPSNPDPLFRIRMEVTDDTQLANLSMDTNLMAGTEYYSDAQTVYQPTNGDSQAELPVELGGFTGHADGRAAVLEWTTLSEKNSRGFYVEQKAQDGSWNKVSDLIEGAGNSQTKQSYSHRVEDLEFGAHTFRLRQVDTDTGMKILDGRVKVEVQMDEAYSLQGAYPNPFQKQATVKFAVRESQDVTVTLYNTLGQQVKVLQEGQVPGSQTQTLTLEADRLSSGMYFLRIRGENFTASESITLVR